MLAAIGVLFYVGSEGLVTNTVGFWPLAGFGTLLGVVGVAPWLIWIMKRSATYIKMDRLNAYGCQGGICISAAILCTCLLLQINSPGPRAAPFSEDATVVGWRSPRGRQWGKATLIIRDDDLGRREIVVARTAWSVAIAARHLRVILKPGHLGHPVIAGCVLPGLNGIQPVFN